LISSGRPRASGQFGARDATVGDNHRHLGTDRSPVSASLTVATIAAIVNNATDFHAMRRIRGELI
jgi:hypothetical protein